MTKERDHGSGDLVHHGMYRFRRTGKAASYLQDYRKYKTGKPATQLWCSSNADRRYTQKVERINDQRSEQSPKGGVAPFLGGSAGIVHEGWGSTWHCMDKSIVVGCRGVQSQCALGTWLRLCKGESATESERGKSEGVQARQAALRPWIYAVACTSTSCAGKSRAMMVSGQDGDLTASGWITLCFCGVTVEVLQDDGFEMACDG